MDFRKCPEFSVCTYILVLRSTRSGELLIPWSESLRCSEGRGMSRNTSPLCLSPILRLGWARTPALFGSDLDFIESLSQVFQQISLVRLKHAIVCNEATVWPAAAYALPSLSLVTHFCVFISSLFDFFSVFWKWTSVINKKWYKLKSVVSLIYKSTTSQSCADSISPV